MTISVAIYARVSTQQQTESQTIEQQIERLQSYIKQQSWSLSDEHIFRDDGRSGANLNRPGLDRLRDAIRNAEVELVLITSPDRLSRNYVHHMIVIDEMEHCGCAIEFLDRPMSQDPHDRLLLQIRGAVAEYERTLIADRMRRGRQMKYRAGVLLPWTRAPYGYQLDPDHPRDPAGVRVNEAEAVVVREIYAWYAQEASSLYGLARHLQALEVLTPSGKQLWSLSTLRAILRQPAYTGQVYAERYRQRPAKIRRSATHSMGCPHDSLIEKPMEEWIAVATIPALISQEQFEQVQRKLVQNQNFSKRNNTVENYLLRALVSCGRCQSACISRRLQSGHTYYTCSAKAKPLQSRKEEKCPSRYSPAQELDDLVWQDLCHVLEHPESITQALEQAHGGNWLPQELQARQEQLRKAQTRLKQQLGRLTEAYLAEVIPLVEYQRRRRELEQKYQSLETQEKQLLIQINRKQELSGLTTTVESFCKRIKDGLENANFEQRRRLVELLIDRVIVNDGDVEIRYVIPTSPSSEHIRFCHLRTDYFSTPNLVGSVNCQVPQQIGIDPMLRMRHTQVGLAVDGFNAQFPHQALHSLPVDLVALLPQKPQHFTTAVARRFEILLIQQPQHLQLFV